MRFVRPRFVQAAAAPPASGLGNVQSAYADSGSAAVASQSVSLSAPATAGNLIVVAGVSDATLVTSGITGLTVAESSVIINGVYLWFKTAAGGEQTVTLTPSVSDVVCGAVAEYSGVSTSSPFDQVVKAANTGSTVGPISPGTTATTTQAAELCVCVAGLASFTSGVAPASPVWGNGFTSRAAGATGFATGAQNQALFLGDLVVSSAAAQTASVTWTNSAGAWAAILATFKGA